MTTTEIHYTITKGPSREELFDALRLCNEHRQLTFEIAETSTGDARLPMGSRTQVRAFVMGILPEDGSGHSWIVKLRFIDAGNPNDVVDAYYHDVRRHGGVRMPQYV